MISRVRGKILEKHPGHVVVEAGGIGYELEIPSSVFAELGEVGTEAALYAHLAVRDDAMTLYGFTRPAERQLFRLLLAVAGVGPRLAVNFLSALRLEEIRRAVLAEDADALTVVSGVGRKTARRVIVDLKPRMEEEVAIEGREAPRRGGVRDVPGEATEALVSLGFARREAWAAVGRVMEREGAELGLELLVRLALRDMAPARAVEGT